MKEETEVRWNVIKTLIQSAQAASLRGDVSKQVIEQAEPYVNYILGRWDVKQKKAAPKRKPKASTPPSSDNADDSAPEPTAGD